MSHEVVVYLGPARCGKTRQLLHQYREVLCGDRIDSVGRIGTALWLAPTSRAAAATRELLIDDGLAVCLGPGVTTFDDLAISILASARSPLRRVNASMERELARRAIRAALRDGKLKVYAETARRDGFVDLLLEHIHELRRRGITTDSYAQLGHRFGNSEAHTERAALYAEYQRLLDDNQLIDAEEAPWTACDVLAEGRHPFRHLQLVVADGFTDFTAAQHKLMSLLAGRTRQLLISLPMEHGPGCRQTDCFSGQSAATKTKVATALELPPRSDLFAKTAATLAELRRRHPRLVERHVAPHASNWPALDHITRHIFRHPAQIPAATSDVIETLDRIEIVEAASPQDEVLQIARRIKRRLCALPFNEGPGADSSTNASSIDTRAHPHDIVVVFRSLTEVAPRIREAFSQLGIPYSIESRERPVSTGLLKSLLTLLRLDAEDWPFRRTVAALTDNTLTAIEPSARQAADWLVRELQIASGRSGLLERVEQLAIDRSPREQLGDHAQRRSGAACAALPALRLLSDALDSLPTEATSTEWIEALARFGTTLGLPSFPAPDRRAGRCGAAELADAGDQLPMLATSRDQSHNDQTQADRLDYLAWQSIIDHFASLERLDDWQGRSPQKLSRHELIAALIDAAAHQPLPCLHDDVGRVRVVSAQAARTIAARHLYLAGMSEQAFPSPERPGRLGSEAEYRLLARAAHHGMKETRSALPEPSRTNDEMLLFYEVLSRAEESLTVSYPAVDDKAQQLPPSPYVIEIERVLGGGRAAAKIRRQPPQLSPIPSERSPLAVADWRIQAVARALEKDGDRRMLAGILADDRVQSLGKSIDAGLRLVHARARGESFGPAEGMLTSAAAAARFAERFGPYHLWSPSQWETYAACPYKFFLENVLAIEPLGDLVLETDHMRRGTRLHQVLADFHRQWPTTRGEKTLADDEEAALFFDDLQKVLTECIGATPRTGIDAALLELDRRQILKWAQHHFEHHTRYSDHCSKYGGHFAAAHFELRFGPPRSGDADTDDPHSSDEPFALDIDGERVLVTGRIDRIDVAQMDDKVLFSVIDYKSGRRPSLRLEHIASGEHLQLPLYVEAAQTLVFEGHARPIVAGYWTMAAGFDAKGVLAAQRSSETGDFWTGISDTVRRRVGEFIRAIRSGNFPVTSRDDKCTSRCDFNTVCRIAQVRSLGKTWSLQDDSGVRAARSQKSKAKSRSSKDKSENQPDTYDRQ